MHREGGGTRMPWSLSSWLNSADSYVTRESNQFTPNIRKKQKKVKKIYIKRNIKNRIDNLKN